MTEPGEASTGRLDGPGGPDASENKTDFTLYELDDEELLQLIAKGAANNLTATQPLASCSG
jgi:hypothetical protein